MSELVAMPVGKDPCRGVVVDHKWRLALYCMLEANHPPYPSESGHKVTRYLWWPRG